MRPGKHVIVDLHGCDQRILDDLEILRNTLREAVRLSGATIITDVFHRFSPQGVTGVIVLAESHASLHTWPEHAYAAIDIFTCGERMMTDLAVDYLVKNLGATHSDVRTLSRGSGLKVAKIG